MNMKQVDKE